MALGELFLAGWGDHRTPQCGRSPARAPESSQAMLQATRPRLMCTRTLMSEPRRHSPP